MVDQLQKAWFSTLVFDIFRMIPSTVNKVGKNAWKIIGDIT